MQNKNTYIFDPNLVLQTLENYQFDKKDLQKIIAKSLNTEFLPNALINEKAFFYHFSKLVKPEKLPILDSIEICANNGWYKKRLFTETSIDKLQALISELHVAEHFVRKGFKVSIPKGNGEPDFYITKSDISLSLEVYSPIDYKELKLFKEELRQSLINLDFYKRFKFDVTFDVISFFHKGARWTPFDPVLFCKSHERYEDRIKLIQSINKDIKDNLTTGKNIDFKYNLEDCNTRIQVKISKIEKLKYNIPDNYGCFMGPSFHGDHTFKLFRSLFNEKRKLNKKIHKNQVSNLSGKNTNILLIDISRFHASHEYLDLDSLTNLGEIASKELNSQEMSVLNSYNLILFVISKSNLTNQMQTLIIYHRDKASREGINKVIEDGSNLKQITSSITIGDYEALANLHNDKINKRFQEELLKLAVKKFEGGKV